MYHGSSRAPQMRYHQVHTALASSSSGLSSIPPLVHGQAQSSPPNEDASRALSQGNYTFNTSSAVEDGLLSYADHREGRNSSPTFEQYPTSHQKGSLASYWVWIRRSTRSVKTVIVIGGLVIVLVLHYFYARHQRKTIGQGSARWIHEYPKGSSASTSLEGPESSPLGIRPPAIDHAVLKAPADVKTAMNDSPNEDTPMESIPLLHDQAEYVSKPRPIRSSADPWSHMPSDWQGHTYLAESRFKDGAGHSPPPDQSPPPFRYLSLAYEYAAAIGRQRNRKLSQGMADNLFPRYDRKTGKPLPVPKDELNLSHSGWMRPQLKVSGLNKPKPFNSGSDRPQAQFDGAIDLCADRRKEEQERRDWVVRAFKHSWEGYKKFAWAHDEVAPLSKGFRDPFNGWGVNIFDNLDTLLIFGLNEEYNLARDHVSATDFSYLMSSSSFSTTLPEIEDLQLSRKGDSRPYTPLPPGRKHALDSPTSISTFETVIRVLGGLISAYDLSSDPLMLARAIELGDWLLPALNTNLGLPITRYTMGTNPSGRKTEIASLAEVGSLVLEFTRLSMISGDETYYQAVQRSTDTLDTKFPAAQKQKHGRGRAGRLLPAFVNANNPLFMAGEYTFGGAADSYYEYLIKTAHLLGDYSGQYARMYREAIESAYDYLIRPVEVVPGHPKLVNVGSFNAGRHTPSLQHLTCFAGGMLGLGAMLLKSEKDLQTGKDYTDTCYWAYEATKSGLMPESLNFFAPDDQDRYTIVQKPDGSQAREPKGLPIGVKQTPKTSYIGRPEAIESIFVLWRITGDRKYQDMGWRMFTSWVENSITEAGFAGLQNVHAPSPRTRIDSQESFVMAETLKYYYLLFADRELISLDDYVLSTEAHPMLLPKTNGKEPKRLWTGPGEPKQMDLQSRIGEGTIVQQWSRVQQAAAFAKGVKADDS